MAERVGNARDLINAGEYVIVVIRAPGVPARRVLDKRFPEES